MGSKIAAHNTDNSSRNKTGVEADCWYPLEWLNDGMRRQRASIDHEPVRVDGAQP